MQPEQCDADEGLDRPLLTCVSRLLGFADRRCLADQCFMLRAHRSEFSRHGALLATDLGGRTAIAPNGAATY